MKRTHYRNGDEISLACGCDGCNPAMIQCVLCHERGCPDEWRDYEVDCKECGQEFFPQERGQWYCEGCQTPADDYWFDADQYAD